MIDFKTASRAELDAHMGMNDLQIVDPNVIRKDDKTGMFSVIDIVNAVSQPGKNNASIYYSRLNPELITKCLKLRINGKGRQTPVADLPTLVEIIWELPGKAAKRFRRTSAKYIVRILGGDPSLVDEIKRQDDALNRTEAGREFQRTALGSALGKREREEALLARRAQRVRDEIDILETCKRLLHENGGWLPHNERAYRAQVSHVLQGMCTPQPALQQAPDPPVSVYSVGPYLSTRHPGHKTKDNYARVGALTAFLYRARYRPDGATVDDLKASADHLLKKPFLCDDVTKNGTSQVQVKAYESCDHDLIERAFTAHRQGLAVRDLRERIRAEGFDDQ